MSRTGPRCYGFPHLGVRPPCLFATPSPSVRGRRELDLALCALDLLHPDLDLVAESVRRAAPPAGPPAALEELVLEEPGEADLVRDVLDPRRLSLARRGVLGERLEVVGDRLVREAQLAQDRTMDDEIGVAPDRRGEVAVRRAREAGVAQVLGAVARLLQRAEDECREGLPAAV